MAENEAEDLAILRAAGTAKPQEDPQESAEERRAEMVDKLQKNVRKLKKKLRQIAESFQTRFSHIGDKYV